MQVSFREEAEAPSEVWLETCSHPEYGRMAAKRDFVAKERQAVHLRKMSAECTDCMVKLAKVEPLRNVGWCCVNIRPGKLS